ncbi:MAG TPA: long-chain fatty acid--CoA ligase [Actinomycetota bacterium]|nr:long-chain fatty acid--CoA ligase [Actinomycetota bacterium]
MQATMQQFPLTITHILRHGSTVVGDTEVATFDGDGLRRGSFAEVAARAGRLAAALTRLGVRPGDCVGTFGWNHQEHLEAYYAVPCMGGVLHTLNIRLFADQLTYVINHGRDKVVIADAALVPVLAKLAGELGSVEHYVVVGDGDASALPGALRYEDLLAAEDEGYAWPDLDENSAAAMCYTTGTTGDPKGVVYSHRSVFLHALSECSGAAFGLSGQDNILLVVPMFHAMAWGMPYAAWLVGAGLVFPGPYVQAEPLSRLIALTRPTFAGAVPTVWTDLLRHSEGASVDLSSLRMVVSGGSAVPPSLMERFQQRHGVRIIQAWGMTETSPVAAISFPPAGTPPEKEMTWRAKTGRPIHGVEFRLCDDAGNVLPWDGAVVGEIEARGPWVTGSYHGVDAVEKFHDGWLRTGDVGTIDPLGFVQITDRAKDVIKTGGEWISSVELENHLMGHPAVLEAAAVGVVDERWGERPLACVVLRDGTQAGPEQLAEYLSAKVARWWVPERWAFIDAIPKTSVGKFDKKALRARYTSGDLPVEILPVSGPVR